MKRIASMAIVVWVAVWSGCGDDESDTTAAQALSATRSPTTPQVVSTEAQNSAAADSNEEMVSCLEDATYTVEPQDPELDPGEYQVTRSAGGTIVANIDVLPTAAAARKLEAQLAVRPPPDHVSGQTAVAVLLAADDSDARVIGDCLP